MRPLLEVLKENGEMPRQEAIDAVVDKVGLRSTIFRFKGILLSSYFSRKPIIFLNRFSLINDFSILINKSIISF